MRPLIGKVGVRAHRRTLVKAGALCLMLGLAGAALVPPAHAAVPLGLPTAKDAADPKSTALEALGRQLFSDKRLSSDGSVSCATCHVPERQFTDGRPTARGLAGRTLTRHTPSLSNVRYATSLFWDGRATDLATQVRTPLLGPAEHGLIEEQAVVDIVRRDGAYTTAFAHLLGVRKAALSIRDVGTALAAYEKTLLSGNSPFDRYLYGHDEKAMTPAAVRGLALFRGRAQCESCHRIGEASALLTDGGFHPSPLPLADSVLSQLGTLAARISTLRAPGRNRCVERVDSNR